MSDDLPLWSWGRWPDPSARPPAGRDIRAEPEGNAAPALTASVELRGLGLIVLAAYALLAAVRLLAARDRREESRRSE